MTVSPWFDSLNIVICRTKTVVPYVLCNTVYILKAPPHADELEAHHYIGLEVRLQRPCNIICGEGRFSARSTSQNANISRLLGYQRSIAWLSTFFRYLQYLQACVDCLK